MEGFEQIARTMHQTEQKSEALCKCSGNLIRDQIGFPVSCIVPDQKVGNLCTAVSSMKAESEVVFERRTVS